MFKLRTKPVTPAKLARPVPFPVEAPGLGPGSVGKFAREPNTDYKRRLLEYQQQENVLYEENLSKVKKQIEEDILQTKYSKHAENKRYARLLNDKVNKKMKEYDENIEKRRQNLTEMLFVEERKHTRDVIADLQAETTFQQKLEKINKIKEENEAARKAFVKEKRMQQYLSRCAEMRPIIAHQRCLDAAEVQKIQMAELEAKRQSEKELEHFWHEMMLKYCEASDDREEQDRLKKEKEMNAFKYYSDLQAKEKMAREQQLRKEMLEEKERIDKLRKDIEDEERAFKEMKHKKSRDASEMFKKEMKQRQDALNDHANKEMEVQRAYDNLVEEEIEKEKAKERAKVSTAFEDMIKYKKFLADMKERQLQDDMKMQDIIDANMNKIQKKDEEERCKDTMQRRELLQSVIKGRAQQLEEQRQRAEEEKKKREMEAILISTTIEKSFEMEKQYQQVTMAAMKKYRDDLNAQIEYNKVLEEREKDNMKKIIELAKKENEMYDNIVSNVLSGNLKISETHAFRRVIETQKCPCPKPYY